MYKTFLHYIRTDLPIYGKKSAPKIFGKIVLYNPYTAYTLSVSGYFSTFSHFLVPYANIHFFYTKLGPIRVAGNRVALQRVLTRKSARQFGPTLLTIANKTASMHDHARSTRYNTR